MQPSRTVRHDELVARLERAVGADHARTNSADLDRYARTTSPPGTRPSAIVLPRTTEQVQRIVEIAGAMGVPVYPISRGRNWGYGDACAPTDGQIIIDFAEMNRIELNRELAYVVIEPGVTQRQLHEHLAEHAPELWMDATGAGLEASLVGNTLDRGFGHTRYGDHFATCSGMEIVLADGRVLRTGFGHYENARAAHVYPYGVGPFIDGLFCQSNYGVITRIGLWLSPRPQAFCAYFFYCDRPEQLARMIDQLQPLRIQGLASSTVHIGNDLRVLSARTRYPWDRADGVTPIPDELRAAMARECGIGAWNGGGAIYGTPQAVRATRKLLRKAMRGYHLRFIDDRTLGLARWGQRQLARLGMGKRLGELLGVLEPVYGLLKGIPTDEPLRGAGWRVRAPMPDEPIDPRDEPTGLRWVSPVLPTSGRHADELLSIIEPIYRRHGFEALVTFTMITERAMIAVTNLSFDQREVDEARRAEACYNELVTTLIDRGYIPYRTGAAGYPKLDREGDVFWQVARQIKSTLDPKGIISPGRYIAVK